MPGCFTPVLLGFFFILIDKRIILMSIKSPTTQMKLYTKNIHRNTYYMQPPKLKNSEIWQKKNTFWISHFCLFFSGSLFKLGISPMHACSTNFVHCKLLFRGKTQCVGSFLRKRTTVMHKTQVWCYITNTWQRLENLPHHVSNPFWIYVTKFFVQRSNKGEFSSSAWIIILTTKH